jgi:hypothetical protein
MAKAYADLVKCVKGNLGSMETPSEIKKVICKSKE